LTYWVALEVLAEPKGDATTEDGNMATVGNLTGSTAAAESEVTSHLDDDQARAVGLLAPLALEVHRHG
jgi:hypothetical protein